LQSLQTELEEIRVQLIAVRQYFTRISFCPCCRQFFLLFRLDSFIVYGYLVDSAVFQASSSSSFHRSIDSGTWNIRVSLLARILRFPTIKPLHAFLSSVASFISSHDFNSFLPCSWHKLTFLRFCVEHQSINQSINQSTTSSKV